MIGPDPHTILRNVKTVMYAGSGPITEITDRWYIQWSHAHTHTPDCRFEYRCFTGP